MLPTRSQGHKTERREYAKWPGVGNDIHTKNLIKFPPKLICCELTGSSCEQRGCFVAQRENKPDNMEGNAVQSTNHFVHVWVRDSSFWAPALTRSLPKEKVQCCRSAEAAVLHSSGVLHTTGEGTRLCSLPWTTHKGDIAQGWKKARYRFLFLPGKQPVLIH